MRYRIEHDCRILYKVPVREHHVQIRLAPWSDEGQILARLELAVTPEAQAVARHDGFGNLTHHFAVLGAHQEIKFRLSFRGCDPAFEPLRLRPRGPGPGRVLAGP